MKQLLFISLVVFSSTISQVVFSQKTKSDVFDSNEPITWLGVDYADVRFVGPATGWGDVSTKSPTELRDTYFPAWNNLIKAEPNSFKIESAVYRPSVEFDIEAINKVNAKADVKNLFSETNEDFQLLTEQDVAKKVSKYSLSGDGIGFLLIAEGMSKTMEKASYWATFIDMKTKKALLTKRVEGEAGGFGFRNYWAGSLKKVFKNMKKNFKNWD